MEVGEAVEESAEDSEGKAVDEDGAVVPANPDEDVPVMSQEELEKLSDEELKRLTHTACAWCESSYSARVHPAPHAVIPRPDHHKNKTFTKMVHLEQQKRNHVEVHGG